MMSDRLARVAMVASALVVAGWLIFSLRAVNLQEDGEKTLERARSGSVADEEVARARETFRQADRLNPDLTPLLDEGFLLSATGRRDEALAYGIKAVAKEPQNVQAWTLVYLAAPDRRNARRAKRRVSELNPWLADTLN